MQLWREWWRWCAPLKDACARNRTFLWMCVVLMAFCVRGDLWGVTSFIRALGLDPLCYDRILDFFHSPALDIQMLMRLWVDLVVSVHPGLVESNATGASINSSMRRTYLTAVAGNWATERAPSVLSDQPSITS